jgi:hypothetical protein
MVRGVPACGAEVGGRVGVLQRWLTRSASFFIVLAAVVALWMRFNASPPGGGLLFPSDLLYYYYPLTEQAAERLAAGELPLWNPYACSGIPLLATLQVNPFYPGRWLALLLPAHQALPVLLFIECVLGAWFSALFFRAWGMATVAAAAGGALFAFACLVGQSFWPPQVSSAIWLPWLLLCVEKLAGRWQWRWWIGLVAGGTLQFLGGSPQHVVYTAYVLVPYALLRLGSDCADGTRAWAPAALRLGGLLLAAGLAVGLCGIQLLPSIELIEHGLRGGPLSPAAVHYLKGVSLPLSQILKNSLDPAPKLISYDIGFGGGYFGISTLIMLVVGAIGGHRNWRVWFFLAVTAGSLVLSDGYRGAFRDMYAALASLPTGGVFRSPERLRFLSFFGVAAVASAGFDQFSRAFATARTRGTPAAAVAGAAIVTGLIAGLGSWAAAWRAIATLLLLATIVRWRGRPAVRGICRAAMLVLLVWDLARATGPYGSLRALPKGWSQSFHAFGHTMIGGDAFADLRRQAGLNRLEVVGADPIAGVAPIDKAYRVSCYDPIAPNPWPTLSTKLGGSATSMMLMQVDPERFAAFYDVASVRTILVVAPSKSNPDARALLRALGRQRQIQLQRGSPLSGPLPEIAMEQWDNIDALPRAYLVGRFRVCTGAEALHHIAHGDVDFRATVLLDRDPGMASQAAEPTGYLPATVTSYAAERVEIETSAPQERLLVLTDSYYPGWTARVDGAATEILRANGLYRAVRVPGGSHRVEFEYRPASLRWGAWISLVSFVVLVLVSSGVPWIERRRRAARAVSTAPDAAAVARHSATRDCTTVRS